MSSLKFIYLKILYVCSNLFCPCYVGDFGKETVTVDMDGKKIKLYIQYASKNVL